MRRAVGLAALVLMGCAAAPVTKSRAYDMTPEQTLAMAAAAAQKSGTTVKARAPGQLTFADGGTITIVAQGRGAMVTITAAASRADDVLAVMDERLPPLSP